MSRPPKTVAVIVTHNRCRLLERCINHVKEQTSKPDEILVINNGSTDGTEDLLIKLKIKVINQNNLGSAGGWKRGIDYALENDFEAAWLMDDDGYPDKHALEILKEQFDSNKSCVSSIVLQEDNPNEFVFPIPILNKNNLPVIFSWPRKIRNLISLNSRHKLKTYDFAHLFNGALISISAVKEVGNVNEKFYIYGDEVDYFFRLRKFGRVISVLNAYHYHPDVSKRPYNPTKIYYAIKNSLIINEKYFDSIFLRNILSVLIVLVRTARRNGAQWIYYLIIGKYRNMFYNAISRGLAGSIGRDFNE